MDIRVLASGSAGNAYVVSDGMTDLLLDAGIPMKKIQERTGYRTQQLAGALITHEHIDHCKAAKDLARYGTDLYMSAGTMEAGGFSGHRFHRARALQELRIGTFRVLPFPLEHDAAEPLGYLCASSHTRDRLLYFTDTYFLRPRFAGLTHILGECNYDRDTLWEMVRCGGTPPEAAERIFRSHMSLETFVDLLRANDLSQLRQIYICHMSDRHGNEAVIRETVQRLTGAEVYIC